MITKEDELKLAKLIERNEYASDPVKNRNLYFLLIDRLLPYYDKSRFMLSNLDYAYRKIVMVDNICKILGEYKRYPIHERDLIVLALMSDLHKVIDPFNNKIEDSVDIANKQFKSDLNIYFHNETDFYNLITSTYSSRVCNQLAAKLLHDVNILVRMNYEWYFKAAWHDYHMMKRYDLCDYNMGEDGPEPFKPSTRTDEELKKELWNMIRHEPMSLNGWQNLYIPELVTDKWCQDIIKDTTKHIQDYDTFKNIIESDKYILFKWPV
jgi:hypothetical protein